MKSQRTFIIIFSKKVRLLITVKKEKGKEGNERQFVPLCGCYCYAVFIIIIKLIPPQYQSLYILQFSSNQVEQSLAPVIK